MAGCVHVAIDPQCSFSEVKQVLLSENVRTLYFQERLAGQSVFDEVASLARNAHDGACLLSLRRQSPSIPSRRRF